MNQEIYVNDEDLELENITASFNSRLGARLADLFIASFIYSFTLNYFMTKSMQIYSQTYEKMGKNYFRLTITLGNLLVPFLISIAIVTLISEVVIPTLTKGRTIGKYLTGLRMVSKSGKKANIGHFFDRSLMITIIPLFLLIPYLIKEYFILLFIVILISIYMVLFKEKRRGIHDILGGIYVVYEKEYQEYIKKKLK